MKQRDDLQSRTLTIKRTFDAPVEIVWEAWTQPEHVAEWWAPKGMKVKVVEHNFKVGGKWKYSMPMPDGNDFISEGVYSVIIKFERIFTSADFRPMTEGVEMQSFFEKDGEKTNFIFNVIHATEEYCKAQEKMGFYNGWGSALERLNTLVKTLKK